MICSWSMLSVVVSVLLYFYVAGIVSTVAAFVLLRAIRTGKKAEDGQE